MGKKKKNQSSGNNIDETRKSSSDHVVPNNHNIQQKALVLRVRRGANGSKNLNISEENERIISIHEDDAHTLNVNNNDYALIVEVKQSIREDTEYDNSMEVLWDNTMKPKFICVCKIKVIRSSNNNNNRQKKQSSFSPKSPNQNNNNKNDLLRGEARIQPESLSQRIFMGNNESNLLVQEQPKTPVYSTPQSKQNTNFSFKSFVKSPSSQTKSASKENHHTKLAILPLKVHKNLSQSLLFAAPSLHLKLVRSSKSVHTQQPSLDVLKRSVQLLKRMVHFACQDNYYRYDDIIKISFQGIKIQFEVMEIPISDNPLSHEIIEQLKSKVAQLTIQENQTNEANQDGNNYNLSQSIVSQLLEKTKQHILMYISQHTQIEFHFDEENYNILENNNGFELTDDVTTTKNRQVVAGVDAVLEQVHTFLKPTLLHPELFPKSGPIRAPKGILLYGTSGTGKSLLAKQIEIDIQNNGLYSEIGNDIKVDVIYVNCASIQATTSIIGEAERKLTKIFESAESRTLQGSSILLILDDVHLICPRRGSAGGGDSDRVASTLLALMDGIGQSYSNEQRNARLIGNVAVLAITSNPTLLDPALRRAGRLDNEIEVPNPDDSARAEIFSLAINELMRDGINVPTLDHSKLLSYAKLAKGFTGGDCALCIKEAVRLALNRSNNNKININDDDIKYAIKATKPSAIKSITVEIPSVPWSSIGGMDGVKKLLREAIELPMTHSHLFEALHISPPRGVLLYGPPGCSKTLMARALATEGNMNFLTVKGPELLS